MRRIPHRVRVREPAAAHHHPPTTETAVTLVEFLLARITEDETLARDAAATHGTVTAHHTSDAGDPYRPDQYDERRAAEAFTLNINPYRVLAECEAKRRIIEIHKIETERLYEEKADGTFARTGREEYTCLNCDDPEVGHIGYHAQDGCPTLRVLAAVYAGHPDYREGWRP